MAMKQAGRKQYKSMQGKVVDMDMLRQRNELTPAVGNARVNARGDELGPGGKIIKKREDVMKEYYEDQVATVPDQVPTRKEPTKAPVVDEAPKTRAQKKLEQQEKVKEPIVEEVSDTQWVEDDDGNFVKKGD